MKKYILIVSIFSFTSLFAQYNKETPWMKELQKKSAKGKYTLKEISDSFNAYWKQNEDKKDKKGSGYKPFKRWENRWKNNLDKNGYLNTPNKLWQDWQDKKELTQRNLNDLSNWQNIGPYTQTSKSGQGRVNTITVDPNNQNIIYVGAPAGGIWKSTDTGNTWTPLSDHLPQIGVSGIAIDPNNSDIIYIATGDDDAGDSYSIGVLKSIDGGITWNQTELQFMDENEDSNEIYINQNNSQMLWVATSDGLYKTTDGGDTWNRKLFGNIRDLKIKPNNPNYVYAVTSNEFYLSTDGGESFNQITNGLPSFTNRMAIEVTPADPNIIYLLAADNSNGFEGLYKSTNSGLSFNNMGVNTDIFGGSTQSWYDMALTVSDTDADIVFVGVLDIWKSTNGGTNFSQLNYWYDSSNSAYTHADIHFLRYFNGKLFCGSDGGIYKSTNDGNVFNELNEGLAISQFYRIDVAKQSANNIAGGLQDNGGFAYSNNTWYNYHGGDGMEAIVDPNNPKTYYGFTQYGGSLSVTHNGGITGTGVTSSPESGNWITPLTINSQSEIFAGYTKLYKLTNNYWQQISGDVFGGRIDRIEIDPNNEATFYIANNNILYKSTDNGVTFTTVFSANGNINSVEVNNDDSNIIYITTADETDGVFKSVDGGNNFISIMYNLPSESKNIIKHQLHSPNNDLYLGTNLGVYHINDTMTQWETYANNLPNVAIRDLEININDKKVIVGTYGRSVWASPIEVTLPNEDLRLINIKDINQTIHCDSNLIANIEVKNNGLNIINNVALNYSIDGVNYNLNHSQIINSEEIIEIPITLPNNLSVGKHTITVEATTNNDAYSDNNTSHADFFINQSNNHPTQVIPFNSNVDEWLIVGNNNVWEITNPSTTQLSAINQTGYTTIGNSNYPDNVTSYLVSPCYNIANINNPILKFDMAFDLEQDWDVLYMEYSTDNGTNWNVLGTANDPNWYNSSFDGNQLPIGSQWTGTDTTLKEYSFNLNSLTNETNIIFRYTFLTDSYVNNEGVFIDNFVIEGQVLNQEENSISTIKIYPNPSDRFIHIKSDIESMEDISIIDITGKLVYNKKSIHLLNYSVDLKNLDNGIYSISIKTNNNVITKKIILNK